MAHGYFVSGVRQTQYHRIVEAAGVGNLGDRYLQEVFASYKHTKVQESTYDTLLEEMVIYPDTDGISILTDAWHATSKNARFTDMVCLGAETPKVLRVETVSRADDPCAQRHELLGTQRGVYWYIEEQEGGSVHIGCHNRNASLNNELERRSHTLPAPMTLGMLPKTSPEKCAVCIGSRQMEGKTWHCELSDKATSIKTHIYWSMNNCDHSPWHYRTAL
ncbi:hypothetical protein ACOMHN_023288 [Nucella lapillus]